MAQLDIALGRLPRADRLDEVRLMELVGEHAELLRLDLPAGGDGLPPAAVSADVHQLLRAVDLDPRRVQRPGGELVAVPHVAGCLLHVRPEAGVLAGHREVAEIVRDGLHLGDLLLRAVGEVARGAVDAVRMRRLAEHDAGEVHGVAGVAGQCAAGVVPPVVPPAMPAAVVLVLRRRAQPGVPVEALGLGALGPAAPLAAGQHVEHLHMDYFAQLAALEVVPGGVGVRGAAVLRAALDDPLVLPGGLDHLPPLADVERDVLLDVDVLARLARPYRRQCVPVLRRGDNHAVDVLVAEERLHLGDELRFSALCLADLAHAPGRLARVDVADVLEFDVLELGETHRESAPAPARADQAEDDLVVGLGRPCVVRRHHGRRRGRQTRRAVNEAPSVDLPHDVSPVHLLVSYQVPVRSTR